MHREHEDPSVGTRPRSNPGHEVQLFLDAYGDALTHGDVEAITSMWHVPALVLSGANATAVSSTEEIEHFFTRAVRDYEARGIATTNPEIQEIQWLTQESVVVYTRWPWLDAHGREHGAEYSTYVLQRDDTGELRLRVAILRGDTHAAH